MSTTVRYSAIRRMLREHDPDLEERVATHSRVISSKGRKYSAFPKHDNIEVGHVKKLVTALGIDIAVAQAHFPQIFGSAKKAAEAEAPRQPRAASNRPTTGFPSQLRR